MRYLTLATMLALGLLAVPALANPAEGDNKAGKSDRPPTREQVVKEFDKDGDGKLNEKEREKAREAMRERFGPRRGEDRGPRADRRSPDGPPRARGPEGRRGPGPERSSGPQHSPPPSPERLFKKFDADNSGSLSREEFLKLTEFVKEHHTPPGPPRGSDFRGRGPEGRGPEGRGFRGPDGPPPSRDGESRRGEWRRDGGPSWRGEDRGERRGPRDGERRRRGEDAEKKSDAADESA